MRARRGLALKTASPELFTAASISVKRLCAQADSLPASKAALLHLAACCLAAIGHHKRDIEKVSIIPSLPCLTTPKRCILSDIAGESGPLRAVVLQSDKGRKCFPQGVLSQGCTLSVTCLHVMAVAAPHILSRLDSYPALLEQLVSLACPDTAQHSSAAGPAIEAHCVEGRAVQLAAVSSMGALAAHDKIAKTVYVSRLLPMALAAPSSHESCWQAVLAACPAVLAAIHRPAGVEVAEHGGSSTVREIVRNVINNESLVRRQTAEGPIMDARRLCRLMQLHVCS